MSRAVVFDSREYQFSHGKRPTGRGCWAFYIGLDDAPTFIPGTLLFSQARVAAAQIAKARGATTVRVAP